jgi:hypoxanthine phosphoribosyltransferase
MKLLNLSLATLGVFTMTTFSNNPPKQIKVRDKTFAVTIPHEKIMARTQELAAQITADYEGKCPIFIGVLNGATLFMTDLVKEVGVECEIDFIKVGSYGGGTRSSGTIMLSKEVSRSIKGRDIIIVEDIIDSGLTIQFVKELLEELEPASIRIATLLHKDLCSIDFPVEYVGFHIEPEFVIGYGLDYDHVARNLKDIYSLVG